VKQVINAIPEENLRVNFFVADMAMRQYSKKHQPKGG